MNRKTLLKLQALSIALIVGCSAVAPEQNSSLLPTINESFNDYWYSGKAEVSTYDLNQVRYGEKHKGEAVFVFVTEDLLSDEQVKYEGGDGEKTSVLKLNAIRRFRTGIYDYSIMRSVFTPVSENLYPHTLKVSHSAQDWCGQSWTQINLRNDKYRLRQFSYFMNEGDREMEYNLGMLEDELFNRIRLGDPIPEGKTRLIPSLDHVRMKHIEPKPYEASISSIQADEQRIITVTYPQLRRTLRIKSEQAFPHRILEWSESIYEGGKEMTTTAKLRATRRSAYWSENGTGDSPLRKELKLDQP